MGAHSGGFPGRARRGARLGRIDRFAAEALSGSRARTGRSNDRSGFTGGATPWRGGSKNARSPGVPRAGPLRDAIESGRFLPVEAHAVLLEGILGESPVETDGPGEEAGADPSCSSRGGPCAVWNGGKIKLDGKEIPFMREAVITARRGPPSGRSWGGSRTCRRPAGSGRHRGGDHAERIAKEDVEQVIMGNVLPAGAGQAPARQAGIYAGSRPRQGR
jgi:hypothetical protein